MEFPIIIFLDTLPPSHQYDLEKNQLLVLVFLSESNFPFLDLFVFDKNRLRQKSRLKDPLPPVLVVRRLYTKSYCIKVYVLRGQFLKKKLSVPRGNFSNYFMKILVFSQLYRSKSAALEIAYDIKIYS